MSLVRTLFFVGLLASLLSLGEPVFAGGALHGGFGFHGGGFHGGFGFRGGFSGGHIGFGSPGFGFPGHGGFFGAKGFFGGFHPGFVGPGFIGQARPGFRDPYARLAYGYGYSGNYGSGYNRYGWRKWYTYTDFSQINYPGVYPINGPINGPVTVQESNRVQLLERGSPY